MANHFERGLLPHIRTAVGAFELKTVQAVYEKAANISRISSALRAEQASLDKSREEHQRKRQKGVVIHDAQPIQAVRPGGQRDHSGRNHSQNRFNKGKGKATRQPAENPFEDFELLDPPTVTIEREVERLVDDRGVTYTREEIPPDQQSLSTLSSESVSRYSENSMARSLFYLEGYHR